MRKEEEGHSSEGFFYHISLLPSVLQSFFLYKILPYSLELYSNRAASTRTGVMYEERSTSILYAVTSTCRDFYGLQTLREDLSMLVSGLLEYISYSCDRFATLSPLT